MANDAQMPERIWAWEWPQYLQLGQWSGRASGGTIEYIRADLCASGQQVRALEWTDLGGGSFRAFLPIFGSVRVEPYGCCDWWEVLWSMPGQCDKLIPDVFDNPDDAKAAAQAEYERRILAALTPAPQPAGEAVPVSGNLFIDSDGDLCIAGRVNNLVACLATDDADGGWKPLNPDVFPEIVRRWNSHPPQPSETVAAVGLTVEQVQKAWTEERDRLTAENNRLNKALEFWTSDHEKRWVTQMARAEKAEAERDSQEADFAKSIAIEVAARLKAEAERDEARAQVAGSFVAAADVLFDHGDGTVEIALDKRLCCNGYHCGCQGATVGLYLQHLIRSLTTADAQSALEAYGREKVREGMRRAYDLSGQYHQITHIRAAILADMETLK